MVVVGRVTVAELAKQYLNRRSDELQPGGFKSVRFSIGLFASSLGARPIGAVRREEALGFTRQVALLGRHVGKTFKLRGASLDRLVAASEGQTISAATQRRIVGQVSQFMDWAVYEGQLDTNPFKTVRVEAKGKPNHYETMTDAEVTRLLALADPKIGDALTLCLLSGMRAGEAVGLVRDDLVWKGNLGWFVWIRPNEVRTLKTDAAERLYTAALGADAIAGSAAADGAAVSRTDGQHGHQAVCDHAASDWHRATGVGVPLVS